MYREPWINDSLSVVHDEQLFFPSYSFCKCANLHTLVTVKHLGPSNGFLSQDTRMYIRCRRGCNPLPPCALLNCSEIRTIYIFTVFQVQVFCLCEFPSLLYLCVADSLCYVAKSLETRECMSRLESTLTYCQFYKNCGVSIRLDRNLVTWAKSNLTSDRYREVMISHML